jgi:hypothetical protein
MAGRAPDHAKNSALAHHQTAPNCEGADCCRCPAAFPDFFILIQRRAMTQDCSEREQVRTAVEHDVAIDLDRMES